MTSGIYEALYLSSWSAEIDKYTKLQSCSLQIVYHLSFVNLIQSLYGLQFYYYTIFYQYICKVRQS